MSNSLETEMLTDRQTDKKTEKKQKKWMELYQFQKEPSYDGDLSPCQVSIRLDKLFLSYSPEMKMSPEIEILIDFK